jgi:hypothetical protein
MHIEWHVSHSEFFEQLYYIKFTKIALHIIPKSIFILNVVFVKFVRSEKSTFLPVLGRFCMRALWRGFEWKIPIFCPRSQLLAGSSHAVAIFPNRTYHWSLIMRFLDSWHHGASAGCRVDIAYPNISGIESNNWVYFKAVCQVVRWLYGARLYGKI